MHQQGREQGGGSGLEPVAPAGFVPSVLDHVKHSSRGKQVRDRIAKYGPAILGGNVAKQVDSDHGIESIGCSEAGGVVVMEFDV